jgi:phosphoribosyl-dephospho-CoA transferase
MLERHQLIWLTERGWQQAIASQREKPREPVLALWAKLDLPLVVTRQSTPEHLSLGLAAPLRFSAHRRTAVVVDLDAVRRRGAFPVSHLLTSSLSADRRGSWMALCESLTALGCSARVYGGYGWQMLTGFEYVHAHSDLDLILPVASPLAADAVCAQLQATVGLPRLDGELIFSDGTGVAWREWLQYRRGAADRILVKRMNGVALEALQFRGELVPA